MNHFAYIRAGHHQRWLLLAINVPFVAWFAIVRLGQIGSVGGSSYYHCRDLKFYLKSLTYCVVQIRDTIIYIVICSLYLNLVQHLLVCGISMTVRLELVMLRFISIPGKWKLCSVLNNISTWFQIKKSISIHRLTTYFIYHELNKCLSSCLYLTWYINNLLRNILV